MLLAVNLPVSSSWVVSPSFGGVGSRADQGRAMMGDRSPKSIKPEASFIPEKEKKITIGLLKLCNGGLVWGLL